MPEFGPCSEPLCNEMAVRLFDCAHHCMKQVCLQHLIEHDRLIEHNQDYLNNLRTELKQLRTTYLSLIDETKLRLEFEQRLKKHQQVIRDISHLFEINSINIEHYRLMTEKLKQIIEYEKQLNQYSTESFPRIEQVKIESIDVISSTDELGKTRYCLLGFSSLIHIDSLNVSLATRIERLNNNNGQQKRKSMSDDSSIINEYDHEINNTYESSDNEPVNNQPTNCPSIRKLFGECPFWYDGAYGLTEDSHGMYLCPRKKYRELYRHLIQFHKLTLSSVEKICRSIQNKEDPFRENLFELNDIVIDHLNQFQCPFSKYNDESTRIDNSSQRSCRTLKPQLGYTLNYHLIRDHQMSKFDAKQLVYKLKTNSKDIRKN